MFDWEATCLIILVQWLVVGDVIPQQKSEPSWVMWSVFRPLSNPSSEPGGLHYHLFVASSRIGGPPAAWCGVCVLHLGPEGSWGSWLRNWRTLANMAVSENSDVPPQRRIQERKENAGMEWDTSGVTHMFLDSTSNTFKQLCIFCIENDGSTTWVDLSQHHSIPIFCEKHVTNIQANPSSPPAVPVFSRWCLLPCLQQHLPWALFQARFLWSWYPRTWTLW